VKTKEVKVKGKREERGRGAERGKQANRQTGKEA
jgi:hypothetical protein